MEVIEEDMKACEVGKDIIKNMEGKDSWPCL